MFTDVYKIAVKLFVQNDVFAPTEFIPIFHRWIQTHAIENHLLIDVADYAHVPAGPGSLLVSSEANVHMDRVENKLGLLYIRKQPITGAENFSDRLRGVLSETFKIAIKLENEPEVAGRLKFRTDEISIRLNDRLLAPNSTETFTDVQREVAAIGQELYGKPVTVEHHDRSPLALLDVRIKSNQVTSLSDLMAKTNLVHA